MGQPISGADLNFARLGLCLSALMTQLQLLLFQMPGRWESFGKRCWAVELKQIKQIGD